MNSLTHHAPNEDLKTYAIRRHLENKINILTSRHGTTGQGSKELRPATLEDLQHMRMLMVELEKRETFLHECAANIDLATKLHAAGDYDSAQNTYNQTINKHIHYKDNINSLRKKIHLIDPSDPTTTPYTWDQLGVHK